MRILALEQPWASLFVGGEKQIETRSWATDYRGPVAIHASKKFAPSARQACYLPHFGEALARLGFNEPQDIPTGGIIGVVNLIGCLRMRSHHVDIEMTEMCIHCDPRLRPKERAFGLYAPGRYAWLTRSLDNRRVATIPWRGGLGLRHAPPELVAQLAA